MILPGGQAAVNGSRSTFSRLPNLLVFYFNKTPKGN
jgi:hypothetical protein